MSICECVMCQYWVRHVCARGLGDTLVEPRARQWVLPLRGDRSRRVERIELYTLLKGCRSNNGYRINVQERHR